MMLIDARGEVCPKPVIMAEEALSKISEGIVEILVDNEASVKNLTRFASKNGFYTENGKEDNYWRVKIVKGYPCEIDRTAMEAKVAVEQESSRSAEGPSAYFFETMKATKELPKAIFFLNAGVKLTTVNNEIIPILKEIEQMGVEIFSCGTCLKYYNLEEELKVGYRGTTNHIIEGIKDMRSVWIG
jgi:selenium metabolism protein YedF